MIGDSPSPNKIRKSFGPFSSAIPHGQVERRYFHECFAGRRRGYQTHKPKIHVPMKRTLQSLLLMAVTVVMAVQVQAAPVTYTFTGTKIYSDEYGDTSFGDTISGT